MEQRLLVFTVTLDENGNILAPIMSVVNELRGLNNGRSY